MKHDLPTSVNLTCSLIPNKTWGEWFWEDKDGNKKNFPPLPPCAVSTSLEENCISNMISPSNIQEHYYVYEIHMNHFEGNSYLHNYTRTDGP